MHCEQNFGKNILKILIGEKDIVKVRRDSQCRGMKQDICVVSYKPLKRWQYAKNSNPNNPLSVDAK